jgi:hypothetical protein
MPRVSDEAVREACETAVVVVREVHEEAVVPGAQNLFYRVLCVGLPAIFHPCPNISPVPIFPNYF